LVIEDEPRILAFVQRALEDEGLEVSAARDGVAGLDAAQRLPYDLVVLDLMLPGRTGLSLIEELRRTRPDLSVLILSARTDLPTKLRGFALGATDYLAKPFAIDELLARVRVQLRRSAEGETATLRVGAFELDLLRRQARFDDTVTELSDREFALLHRLAEAAGDVVTRRELLADVWGYDFDPGTNVVDVCVRRLRKKLGPGSPIKTIRNVGYAVSVN
jgi:DNA-binding response OmpR family regulator